jgi:hypothetical protein
VRPSLGRTVAFVELVDLNITAFGGPINQEAVDPLLDLLVHWEWSVHGVPDP